VKYVEPIAVFAKKAKEAVFEDTLSRRTDFKTIAMRDALEMPTKGKAKGGHKRVGSPFESVIPESGDYENGHARCKHGGGYRNHSRALPSAQQNTKATTKEEIVRTGEGWRVGEILILKISMERHQGYAKKENGTAAPRIR
jgi:hypothetical protein